MRGAESDAESENFCQAEVFLRTKVLKVEASNWISKVQKNIEHHD